MSKEYSIVIFNSWGHQFRVFFTDLSKIMQFMSQTPLMVFTESPTVVTELPKVATTLLPGCERKSLTTWWRCIGDLLQHCHNSWTLTGNSFTMLVTTAMLADLAIFLNSLKKSPSVSVVWHPLTMEGNVLATYWQCPRDH